MPKPILDSENRSWGSVSQPSATIKAETQPTVALMEMSLPAVFILLILLMKSMGRQKYPKRIASSQMTDNKREVSLISDRFLAKKKLKANAIIFSF